MILEITSLVSIISLSADLAPVNSNILGPNINSMSEMEVKCSSNQILSPNTISTKYPMTIPINNP
jgi:hypothetical protein